MAWFSRFSRFGDAHLVYGQEAGMSCGIASVLMCVFKVNKFRTGAQAVHEEEKIYDVYSKASGGAYKPEAVGTHPSHLVTVLNSLNCGDWKWKQPKTDTATRDIIEAVGTTGIGPKAEVNPVIVGVDWDGGGAHWLVIDTVRKLGTDLWATVCDPWDANLHIQSIKKDSPFNYMAGKGGFKVDVWGKSKGTDSPYGAATVGRLKTWGMIYR